MADDELDEDGFPSNGQVPLPAQGDHICVIVAAFQSLGVDRAGNLILKFSVPPEHKYAALKVTDQPGLLVQMSVDRYRRNYRTTDEHLNKPRTTPATTDWQNDPRWQELLNDPDGSGEFTQPERPERPEQDVEWAE